MLLGRGWFWEKFIGARVCEFKDDFLMGQKPAYQAGDWLDGFCFASNAAEDDLEKLASLVGSRLTLKSPNPADQITMIEDAPALEFDLEDELSQAFETETASQDHNLELAAAGAASINQDEMIAQMQAVSKADLSAEVDANLPSEIEQELPVDNPAPISAAVEATPESYPEQPTEPADDPMLDFNEMIAEELDKALALEVASDPNLQSDGETEAYPSNEIEEELSKLMSFSVIDEAEPDSNDRDGGIRSEHQSLGEEAQEIAQVEPVAPSLVEAADPLSSTSTPPAPPSIPPTPVDVMEPWQEAEVVAELPMPETSVSEANPTSVSSYTPVQMSEFDPVSPKLEDPTTLPHIDDSNSLDAPQDSAGREHIDTVLGGAAALAAAASTKSAKSAETTDSFSPAQDLTDPVALDSFESPDAALEIAKVDDDLSIGHDEAAPQIDDEKRRSGRRAAMAIVAIALLGGTAALAWNFVGSESGDTPTLLASSEPVKVKPKDAGGKVVPNQDQAVYKAVEVQGREAPSQARLTDNKEKPISVGVSPTGQKVDARIDSNQSELNNPLAIKPRSVRTVVVRPDGTIVSSAAPKNEPVVVKSKATPEPATPLNETVLEDLPKLADDAVAKLTKTAIPVSRPVKADTPAAKPAATTPAAKKVTGPAAKVAEAAKAATPAKIVAKPIQAPVKTAVDKPAAAVAKKIAKPVADIADATKKVTETAAKVAAARKAATKPVAKVAAAPKEVAKPAAKVAEAPKKVAKPAEKIAAAPKKVAKPVKVAAVTPKPAKKSNNEVLPQVSSPYAVQVSSQLSAAGAKKSYATLTRRYSSILSGKGLDIRKVNVKGKTYYRVRIPSDSRSAANQLCGQLKAQGGDCFVTR